MLNIVILSYNGGPRLRKCVESVVRQGYEVTVLDNGSDPPVIKDELIKDVVRLPQNVGHIEGQNAVMRMSKGEWILFISDDVAMWGKIIQAIRYVNRVIPAIDQEDDGVDMTLEIIKPDVWCNGGDRTPGNTPTKEVAVVVKYGGKVVWNVGGGKVESSQSLIWQSMLQINAARADASKVMTSEALR